MGKRQQVNRRSATALGATPLWVWHDSYTDLHPPADPLSLVGGESEDDEQTYRQFMDMAKREPNERGTGRWKLSRPDRQTIAIVALDSGASMALVNQVQCYLKAFFHGIPVQIHNTDKKFSFITQSKQNKWYFQTNKSKQQKLKLETCQIVDEEDNENVTAIEVFSLFDAMVPTFVLNHYSCVIGLTSHNLAEQWIDEVNNGTVCCDAVLGRACGDRVCVVQAVELNVTTPTLLATCTHELLHCFGLDHCTTFKCLMNSQSIQGEDCLFLSPLNLKKWVLGVVVPSCDSSASFDNNNNNNKQIKHPTNNNSSEVVAKDYVLERYRAMRAALSSFGFQMEVQWLDRKIAAIQVAYDRAAAAVEQLETTKSVAKRKRQI